MKKGSAATHAVRFYSAVALGVAALSAGVVLHGRFHVKTAQSAERTDDRPRGPSWCAEGLELIADDACFAAPKSEARPSPLLVYLHGRYAPEGASDELERQARVAKMGTAAGYAVLALRGKQGQCTSPTLATWWCWPSNEKNAEDGPAFVARWDAALREVERRTGKGRRVLLGFSNGGYFAALIASRSLFAFDAVAIAHAGPVSPMQRSANAPPLLLIDADDDPSGPEMDKLEAELARESWPHVMVARAGGHALPEWDVKMAIEFFDRTRTERLPLDPPLSTRARRMHPEPDGGPDASDEPAATTPDTAATSGAAGSGRVDETRGNATIGTAGVPAVPTPAAVQHAPDVPAIDDDPMPAPASSANP